ncbi:unnamed protein product [Caenorhabditis sp. 36 PRJEB53466]|nr:unnamed protein product [Caenorhabditis sp. 36 PRJEB53466]
MSDWDDFSVSSDGESDSSMIRRGPLTTSMSPRTPPPPFGETDSEVRWILNHLPAPEARRSAGSVETVPSESSTWSSLPSLSPEEVLYRDQSVSTLSTPELWFSSLTISSPLESQPRRTALNAATPAESVTTSAADNNGPEQAIGCVTPQSEIAPSPSLPSTFPQHGQQ